VPPLDTPAPPSSEELAEVALGGPARNDVVALGVSESLQRYCGGCHSDGANGAGFAGGLDIGELGAPAAVVREQLTELPPELDALTDPAATIERAALASGFIPALCALGTRNRPTTCP
jgi:hypothetical protein